MKFRSSLENGFEVQESGQWRRLCGHVRVKAHLVLETTNKKFAEVEFYDFVERKLAFERVPMENLHKAMKVIDALVGAGLEAPSPSDRERVARCLADTAAPAKRLVSKMGWYEVNKCFVLPAITFGTPKSGEKVKFDNQLPLEKGNLGRRGTIQEWQERVAGPCGYSPPAVLAISACLAAPALEPMGADYENFALHLAARTSGGKTAMLCAARSVTGKGCVENLWTWDNTETGYEEAAEISNSSSLIVDETQLGASNEKSLLKKARSQAYKFVQGQPRKRSRRFQNVDRGSPGSWHGIMISAGEDPFFTMGNRNSAPRRLGELHRLVDVPATANKDRPEFGIFDECPEGFADTAKAADAIKIASAQHYGQPLRLFVKRWIKNPEAAVEMMRRRAVSFIVAANGAHLIGWEKRLVSRFSIIFAAGALASDWKILPWSRKHIGKCVLKCYRSARALLEDQHPQPEKLMDDLRCKIETALQSTPRRVKRQKATDKHCARILVRGSLLRKWFPGEPGEVLLAHIERSGLLIKPASRHSRTIQVRRNGKKLNFYAFDPRLSKRNAASDD